MFRMIPPAVALAAAITFAPLLSAQTLAQPATSSPAPTAPANAAQPPPQPPAVAPIVPAPGITAPTATPQPPESRSMADTEFGTAIVLLERVQKVLDDAANDKTGNVTLDRGVLDELRAEVTQARLTLKGGKP